MLRRGWLLAHRDRPVESYRVAKPGKLKRRSRGPCDARYRLGKRRQKQRDGRAVSERPKEPGRRAAKARLRGREAMLPRRPIRCFRAPGIFSHFKGLQHPPFIWHDMIAYSINYRFKQSKYWQTVTALGIRIT